MVYCLHVDDDDVVVLLKKTMTLFVLLSFLLFPPLSLSLSPDPSHVPLRFDDEKASIIVHLRY